MKASIVKIGNSRGIRIPKPILEQCGFADEVELEVEDNRLIVRSESTPRAGWVESFRAMAENRDDDLPSDYGNLSNDWDDLEWEWK